MPKLPSYQDVGNVSPAVMRDPGVSAPVEAFQSSAGVAAKELAPGLSNLSEGLRKREKLIDDAAVNESRRALLDLETEQTEWLSQQKGANVFDAKAKMGKAIEARLEKIRGGLQNDVQKALFREVENDWKSSVDRTASRYIAAETDRHYDDVDKRLLETSSRAAQKAASIGEFDRVQQEWYDQEKVIAGFAERKGMDDTQKKAMLDSSKSNFHSGVAMQLIADGNDNSAKQYLDSNIKEFDADDSLKIQNLLKSRRNEKASEFRVAIADKMQDLEAMAQRGVMPPKGFITDAEIDTAYAESAERAAQIKRRRDEGYRFATKAVGVHNESNDDIIAALNQPYKPSGDPQNFAEEARHDDLLKAMRANVLKQRLSAPMEYAAQNKIGVVNEIDFNDPASVTNEIGNRQRTAKMMQDRFGSPLQLLTSQEASNFSRALSQSSPSQKRALFQNFASSLKGDMNSYRSIMSQIAPDDPVTAMAGISANRSEATQQGQLVADLMLRGQSILHPPKKNDGDPDKGTLLPMPGEKDMREKFDNEVRDAFVGTADSVRNQYYQAARAIYASLSMDAGDKNTQDLNSSRWEEAIQLATGGVEKYNGKRTIMPFGYERSRFKKEIGAHIRAMEGALPESVSADKLLDMPVVPFGDGKYVFMTGNSVLADKNGNRLIVDLNKKPPTTKDLLDIQVKKVQQGKGEFVQ